MEQDNFYIPQSLDEPERILFLSGDELGVVLFPFIVLFFIFDAFLLGAASGLVALFLWKKFKGSEHANLHLYAMYWYYPHEVMKLKATPPSHIRKYYG